MKSKKINYLIVGTFVIAAAAMLLASILLLSGRTGATDSYHAVYRNVTGVKFGTQVLYEGYPVGHVDRVTPVPVNGGVAFRVDFSITRDWRIPEDSRVHIRAPGLLAAITLFIEAGESPRALEPGAQVIGEEAPDMFAVVSSMASDIEMLVEDALTPMLASVERTVTVLGDLLEEDGRLLIHDILALVDDVHRRVPPILDHTEAFSAEMSKAATELSALMSPGNRAMMEEVVVNLNRVSQEARGLMADADRLLEQASGAVVGADDLVGRAGEVVSGADRMVTGNQEAVDAAVADLRYVSESMARQVDTISHNLEGAARNLNEFTRQIRQNPALLLGGSAPQDDEEAATER